MALVRFESGTAFLPDVSKNNPQPFETPPPPFRNTPISRKNTILDRLLGVSSVRFWLGGVFSSAFTHEGFQDLPKSTGKARRRGLSQTHNLLYLSVEMAGYMGASKSDIADAYARGCAFHAQQEARSKGLTEAGVALEEHLTWNTIYNQAQKNGVTYLLDLHHSIRANLPEEISSTSQRPASSY